MAKHAIQVLRASGINLDRIIDQIPGVDAATYDAARKQYDKDRGFKNSRSGGRGRKNGEKNRARLIFGHGKAPNSQSDSLMSLALIVASDAVTKAGDWRAEFPHYSDMSGWIERDESKARRAGLVTEALRGQSAKDRATALAALDIILTPGDIIPLATHYGRPIVAAQEFEHTANAAAGRAPKHSTDYAAALAEHNRMPLEVVAGRAKRATAPEDVKTCRFYDVNLAYAYAASRPDHVVNSAANKRAARMADARDAAAYAAALAKQIARAHSAALILNSDAEYHAAASGVTEFNVAADCHAAGGLDDGEWSE